MTKKRRRFKQTTPLQDRLALYSQDIRERAAALPDGVERQVLLQRASRADIAADIDQWRMGAGLPPQGLKRSLAR